LQQHWRRRRPDLLILVDSPAVNLELARRRLRNLARWGLGGVSLALAIYLLVVMGDPGDEAHLFASPAGTGARVQEGPR